MDSRAVRIFRNDPLDEMQSDKPVLPEVEHLRGKITDEQLEAIQNVLERNEEGRGRGA